MLTLRLSTDDSANFGIFKQNWGMMRVCGSRYGFAGQSEANWNNGAAIKYNFPIPSQGRTRKARKSIS